MLGTSRHQVVAVAKHQSCNWVCQHFRRQLKLGTTTLEVMASIGYLSLSVLSNAGYISVSNFGLDLDTSALREIAETVCLHSAEL